MLRRARSRPLSLSVSSSSLSSSRTATRPLPAHAGSVDIEEQPHRAIEEEEEDDDDDASKHPKRRWRRWMFGLRGLSLCTSTTPTTTTAVQAVFFVLMIIMVVVAVVTMVWRTNTASTQLRHIDFLFLSQSRPAATKPLVIQKGCFQYGCPLFPPEVDKWMSSKNSATTPGMVPPDSLLLPPRLNDHLDSRVGLITRRSNRRDPPFNQDTVVLYSPFIRSTTERVGNNVAYLEQDGIDNDSNLLVALFDGHGQFGHNVSSAAGNALPRLLASKLSVIKESIQSDVSDNDAIISALNSSFVETDANLSPSIGYLGGTTGSVTLRIGRKLFIANAGDSRTIVVAYAARNGNDRSGATNTDVEVQYDIVYASRFDKAHLPDEQHRIESLGGHVRYPPDHPMRSRVWVKSKAAHGETIGLAMSRSLGDWEWGEVGVIPEPIVDVIDWEEALESFAVSSLGSGSVQKGLFVLAASDGVWDMRARPNFFANYFAGVFARSHDGGDDPLFMQRACYGLLEKISPRNASWYRDDMTLAVARLV